MPKVALRLRDYDLPAEVLDFQACWDGLTKKLNLLSLAREDVTSTDETIFPFVQAGLELVIERLECEAFPCKHQAKWIAES